MDKIQIRLYNIEELRKAIEYFRTEIPQTVDISERIAVFADVIETLEKTQDLLLKINEK